MRFVRTDPDASFTLPDHLTFKQKLDFSGEFSFATGGRVLRSWEAAKTLIADWVCEVLPDPKINLDDLDALEPAAQVAIRKVIVWAASEALIYVNSLDSLPKN